MLSVSFRNPKHPGVHAGMGMILIPRTCAHTACIYTNSITHRHVLGSLCRNLRVARLRSRRVIRLVMITISWSASRCCILESPESDDEGGKKHRDCPLDDVTQNPESGFLKKYVARIQVRSRVRIKSPPYCPHSVTSL